MILINVCLAWEPHKIKQPTKNKSKSLQTNKQTNTRYLFFYRRCKNRRTFYHHYRVLIVINILLLVNNILYTITHTIQTKNCVTFHKRKRFIVLPRKNDDKLNYNISTRQLLLNKIKNVSYTSQFIVYFKGLFSCLSATLV